MESGVFACLQGVCSQGLQVPSPCAAALRQGLGLSEGEKGAQVCNMAGGTVPGGEVKREISCLCGSPVPCKNCAVLGSRQRNANGKGGVK